MGGSLLADNLQHLAALQLANAAADQWRQVPAARLAQIDRHVGDGWMGVGLCHLVHLLGTLTD